MLSIGFSYKAIERETLIKLNDRIVVAGGWLLLTVAREKARLG